MAVSCPEVMYGAYYPYLYGRGAARSFHHAPHFQYDRFNVQGNAGSEAYGGGAAALSSGSASSGAQSPASPPHAHAHHAPHAARLRAKEEDLSAHGRASADGGGSSESEGECAGAGAARARAQYVSANCVVFTHYSGDVAAVVDEHFARALSLDKPKGVSESTIRRIVDEGMKNGGKFITPVKHKKGRPKKQINDFDLCAIREKVQFFYTVLQVGPSWSISDSDSDANAAESSSNISKVEYLDFECLDYD